MVCFHFFFFQYKNLQIDSFSICKSIDKCLELIRYEKKYYLAVGGSRQRILNSRSYSPSKIFCFGRNENIASYYSALLIRNEFRLLKRINDIIRNAFESGLFVKWDLDNQRKKERMIPFEIPDQLTIEHYSGTFIFLITGGTVLATMTLLAERVTYRKMQNPNRSRFWMYLECILDGERHCLKNWTWDLSSEISLIPARFRLYLIAFKIIVYLFSRELPWLRNAESMNMNHTIFATIFMYL